MKKIQIPSRDGYPLSLHIFEIDGTPKAVVQIIHGMEEHQERYEDFARFLNEQGFLVVTSDMRGHGTDVNHEDLGYFKEKNGYRELVHDQIYIRAFIRNRYPDLPVFLFAHSMGTIIARVLLQTQSKHYEKVVLSGYPNYQARTALGIICSAAIRTLRGPKYKSKFLQKSSVGAFNQSIENPKTDSDWICANEEAVEKYLGAPYCGIGFTCSAFNDLFHLVMMMHKSVNYRNVNRDMPILCLRGEDDPCTGGDKGSQDSIDVLLRAGFDSVQEISYPGMRHEILNEADHRQVYEDVADFYRSGSQGSNKEP